MKKQTHQDHRRNPLQPFVMDGKVVRFKANAIVRYLLDEVAAKHGVNLNELACLPFSQDDRVQFAQLIGYSLVGFHELSYVPDKAAIAATRAARKYLQMPNLTGCRDDGGCEIHSGVEWD